ncbi:amphiregulin [Varanus komodoensis]|uniref:amphiregulin n=1 Tax=Varanus komodoensis TaxID=61221 RepID=UPI001CF7E2D7|nr:amphiregulin [Varanus komodoensis]
MRATLSLLLLLLLPPPPLPLWGSVCQHVTASELNVTEHEPSLPILRTLDTPTATEMFSSGADYEEAEEENVKEVIAPQFFVGDSGRGEIKKPAKFVSGKKSPNKPKIRGNNEKKNRKKKSPCEGKFKNFCVHGECKYIKDIQAPTCKCHQDYFGERCIEQFLKTQRSNDAAGHSTTVLMVHSTTVLVKAAVGLSVLSFIVIVIIVIVQKKCPKYDEKEERKKLQQDNASSSNGV